MRIYGGKMKTKKAEDTQNAIVQAAKQLFMVKSVSKVTVADITKLAGVAKGTFYVYFDSKDDLVRYFIDQQLDAMVDWFKVLENTGYEEEDIKMIVSFFTSYVKKNEKTLRMMHHVRFFGFLGITKMESRYLEDLIKPVTIWLERGKAMGKLDIIDPYIMSCFFVLSIHEVLDRIIVEDLDFSFDDFEENIKHLLLKLLK